MVVAQLVERLLPKPEIRGSNPVIGKIYLDYQLYKKTKKGKRGREWLIKKTFCDAMCTLSVNFGQVYVQQQQTQHQQQAQQLL